MDADIPKKLDTTAMSPVIDKAPHAADDITGTTTTMDHDDSSSTASIVQHQVQLAQAAWQACGYQCQPGETKPYYYYYDSANKNNTTNILPTPGELVWVLKSKGRKNSSSAAQRWELFSRARVLDQPPANAAQVLHKMHHQNNNNDDDNNNSNNNNDDDDDDNNSNNNKDNDIPHVWIQYPKGSTYYIAVTHLLPVHAHAHGPKKIWVYPETALYRKACVVHTTDQGFMEIGCDHGATLARVAQESVGPAVRVLGVDKAADSVASARQRHPHLPIVQWDCLKDDDPIPSAVQQFVDQHASSAFHLAVDIGGNRDLTAVLQCLQRLLTLWRPRLVLVKSRALWRVLQAQQQNNDNGTIENHHEFMRYYYNDDTGAVQTKKIKKSKPTSSRAPPTTGWTKKTCLSAFMLGSLLITLASGFAVSTTTTTRKLQNIVIAPAQIPQDLPQIQACRATAMEALVQGTKTIGQLMESQQVFVNATTVAAGRATCWIARDGRGRVWGTADVAYKKAPGNNNRLVVCNVYVDPAARGQGLARQLMAAIEQDAQRQKQSGQLHNVPGLALEVYTSNVPAYTLYQSIDYETRGVHAFMAQVAAVTGASLLVRMEKDLP